MSPQLECSGGGGRGGWSERLIESTSRWRRSESGGVSGGDGNGGVSGGDEAVYIMVRGMQNGAQLPRGRVVTERSPTVVILERTRGCGERAPAVAIPER